VPTITSRVNQSADDAHEVTSGAVNITGSLLFAGKPGTTGIHMGLRFTDNIAGLSGATIDDAYITFRAVYSDTGNFLGNWYAEVAAAPGVFTTGANDITNRTRTTTACRGDGVLDFGDWSAGGDHVFRGTGPFELKALIQELLDAPNSFDPSAIVLVHIYGSSSGERIGRSYDGVGGATLAPLLTIDYTAATGAVETSPSAPVPIHVAIQTPTVGVRPSPVPIHVAIQTPRTGVHPSPVPIHVAIPTPQIVAGVKVYPEPVLIHVAIQAPTLGVRPTPVPIHVAIITPVATSGPVSVFPSPVLIHVAIITPVATGTGAAEAFEPFGVWDAAAQEYVGLERFLDASAYASGTLFLIEVGLDTSNAVNAAKAYLYCVDAAQKVPGSDATSTNTLYEVKRSGTFDLLALYGSGLKKYTIWIGGATGGDFGLWGGDILAVSS
jgi:hypothetical protein